MRDTHSSPGQGWNDYSNRALAGSFAAAECSVRVFNFRKLSLYGRERK